MLESYVVAYLLVNFTVFCCVLCSDRFGFTQDGKIVDRKTGKTLFP